MNSLFVPGRQVWLTTPVVVDGYQSAAPGDLVCIVSVDGLFRRGLTVRIPGGDTVAVGVRDVALRRERAIADEIE